MKKELLLIITAAICTFGRSWNMVWSDEFEGTSIDKEKWGWDTLGNAVGWHNDELQYYTHEKDKNSRIENGSLIIEAHKEEFGGKEYTSARLRTKGKASWLYGKVEIRAKLPAGRGTWPALWMMPEDDFYGGWPNSGEIDIMEYLGMEPDNIYSTVHTKEYNHRKGSQKGSVITIPAVADQFHTYRVEWFPDSICFYVDSTEVYTFKPEVKDPGKWPFNKPFHILMNSAIGGWGGDVDNTIFPVKMVIDYVRVYEESDTPITVETVSHGAGSISITPLKETYAPGDVITVDATPDAGMEFLNWSGALSSTNNPVTYTVKSHTSFGASFKKKGELIRNGDFSEGLDNWIYHNIEGTEATFLHSDTGAVVSVTKKGAEMWDIQFIQQDLLLKNGKDYTVKAVISSPDSLSSFIRVGMSQAPWDRYFSEEITLNKEKKEFFFSFTMARDDPDGRFIAELGNREGTLTFHSVSILENSESSNTVSQKSRLISKGVSFINNELHIHPNMGKCTITILDLKGRKIFQKSRASGGEIIRFSDFPLGAGIHYAKVITDKGALYGTKFLLH